MGSLSPDCKFRIHGAITGYILGDILCNILQEKAFQYEYSNISAAMLSTGYSLTTNNEIELKDILDQLHNMYIGSFMVQNDELLNCGQSMVEAINHSLEGMPPDKTGVMEATDDEYLTLILPVALFSLRKTIPEFIANVQNVCKVINQTPNAQLYSCVYALVIRNLVLQEQVKATNVLGQYYHDNNQEENIAELNKMISSENKSACFWRSWDAYLHNENDYPKAVNACLSATQPNLNAAITGSIWGAANGLNEIPFKLVKEYSTNLSLDANKVIDSLVG